MLIDSDFLFKLLNWVKEAIILDTRVASSQKRMIKRGEVYRCNFGVGIGSEIQKDRPVVILQNDIGNLHSGNTVVAPITHGGHSICLAPITTIYESDGVTVKLDGSVNTSNVMCVSKARLGNYVDKLSQADMDAVDAALARELDLMKKYSVLEKKYNNALKRIKDLESVDISA